MLFSCLSELSSLRRQLTELGQRFARLARLNRLVQLVGEQVEGVFGIQEGAHFHQAMAQFENHGAQYRPARAHQEGDFVADVSVPSRQPEAVSKLPVLQAAQQLRDLFECLLTYRCRLGALMLRVAALVADHRFQRGKQPRGVFRLCRFDEVEGVPLVPVGRQVLIDCRHDFAGIRVLAQRRYEEFARRDDHQVAQLIARSNQLGDFEQIFVGLQGLRLDPGEELTAGKVVVR